MKKGKGFTLIELLVVIAIIGLLMAIIMPALRKVKDQARQVICASNIHGVGNAVAAYAAENDDSLLPWGAGSKWATNKMPLHWMYAHTPRHGNSQPNAGYEGLGFLYRSGILDNASDIMFCPTAKDPTTGANYEKGMNSNGSTDHWNYVGPGSSLGQGLLPRDSGINWINMRTNYGVRCVAFEEDLYSGQNADRRFYTAAKLSHLGFKAYLSDWWCGDYWYQSTIQSLPHGKRVINTWYGDGSVSGYELDEDLFEDTNGDGKIDTMRKDTTWKIIYENGTY